PFASFVLPCYRHPRDLPSFPTRRSSDLRVAPGGAVVVAEFPPGQLRSVARLGHRLAGGHVQVRVHPQDGNGRVRGRGRLRVVEVDRKSTRLNSSHVKISYAVFCLKKKTN